ncbi:hypothetical protein CXG81DRAFT_10589 [Caulochytrium protostelioides]|uniref:D-2-hydroxyglutarate dehydrogenase, mitochondrial n=1 Tax=Caulochytrium protostelioides TaxID=1555241 RepID=A0A4P9XB47_9FUNG|nr:hypothetical protein CXG81DRAFT_10589 [Caulochytrium protostelioides]|eukprot:RKP02613.1 hypothetical protein CXG81DRAFT_10589 [Caulochytrium protostelioides]
MPAGGHPVARNASFARLTPQHVEHFRKLLGHEVNSVTYATDPDDMNLLPYNVDWIKKYRGQSQLVLKPSTTAQVSQVLAYCHAENLAVVPQGGNTGLVGGSVPVFDEIVLSTGRLNAIRHFDDVSGIVVAEAGVVLESLDNYVGERGFMCPLDLGAKGSCHIGGNVATNAGGLRVLRYGSLHGSVLGLEVVLADGTVVDMLRTLRKDNTGYDLKQLFIGSEGSLGVITAVSLLTPPRLPSTQVGIFAVSTFEDVQRLFIAARRHVGEILSAFEFWDRTSQQLVETQLPTAGTPHLFDAPFYVLLETQGSDADMDREKLERFIERAMDEQKPLVENGAIAQDQTQARAFWETRENISDAATTAGACYKYDISMPVPVLYDLVNDAKAHLKQKGLYDSAQPDQDPVRFITGYGHLGDGNLHLNVVARDFTPEVTQAIEPWVYEWTQRHQGSVSAEHGVGFMKPKYVSYSKDEHSIRIMHGIKAMLDPKGIMNPYKVLQ